jgi:hypothetical protein
MPLSPSGRVSLDRWFNGQRPTQSDPDIRRTVDNFVDLYLAGERPSATSIRQWAIDRGWSEAEADACGQLYSVVVYALRRAGAVPLRP